MSPQPDIADGFQAEQTWRQLQFERHQRFLAQLKAEFHALRPPSSLRQHSTTSVPAPTARVANSKSGSRSSRSPRRNPRPTPATP